MTEHLKESMAWWFELWALQAKHSSEDFNSFW